jgi:hypothetical protein
MKITKEVADFANWVEVKHRKNRNSKKKEFALLQGWALNKQKHSREP